MKEILEFAFISNLVLSFSFENAGQITIGVRNWKLGKHMQQCLPWDHIYDQKVLDCIKYMDGELSKAE